MSEVRLPLEQPDILKILPHRYPFLFVDRIVAFEPDRRIVGIKVVSHNEPMLSRGPGAHTLPAAVLTETVAQVGAILVLLKPENRDRLVFSWGSIACASGHPCTRATSSRSKRSWSCCATASGDSAARPGLTAELSHMAA